MLNIHRQTGVTVVFVTHDLREALRLGTWILVMNEGEIVEQGTPKSVAENPNDEYTVRLLEQLEC
ncbi:MAG: glycine/betaine ABC transporter ATP-binding protein [Christensenella sp.]